MQIGETKLHIKVLTEKQTRKWVTQNIMQIKKNLKRYGHKKSVVFQSKAEMIDWNFGPIEMGELNFSSLKQLREKIKMIVVKSKNGDNLAKDDQNLMEEILRFHSNTEKKVGGGIKAI